MCLRYQWNEGAEEMNGEEMEGRERRGGGGLKKKERMEGERTSTFHGACI